ncbi:DUF397 domain-containing protein [Allonocardiopsis opalescens]|uniref:Uncharacterized protein DUF397 n=1 Tax=Allonocardiopsis opalescens TaxID=1144618 RepID=A0A2T0PVU5_9ACTN|nr:DUF397 domain-containing protein [Allonocardiopsis opalescens]PRX95550.1 uncharacterized protein DUF397 [Allonocardiopsis opalescens]
MPESGPQYRKSSYSQPTGSDCVEVADGPPEPVRVRDSKNPAQPHLSFDRQAWSAFVAHVKQS